MPHGNPEQVIMHTKFATSSLPIVQTGGHEYWVVGVSAFQGLPRTLRNSPDNHLVLSTAEPSSCLQGQVRLSQ